MVIKWNELRDARERLGLTQGQLADELGVATRTITNWEAHGVPRKAEYKVERFFGEALQRGTDADNAAADRERRLSEALDQIDRGEYGRSGTAPHVSRVLLHEALANVPDSMILDYLRRRAIQREIVEGRITGVYVGDRAQDDPHTADLRNELDLAASSDDTVVDPDRQP